MNKREWHVTFRGDCSETSLDGRKWKFEVKGLHPKVECKPADVFVVCSRNVLAETEDVFPDRTKNIVCMALCLTRLREELHLNHKVCSEQQLDVLNSDVDCSYLRIAEAALAGEWIPIRG